MRLQAQNSSNSYLLEHLDFIKNFVPDAPVGVDLVLGIQTHICKIGEVKADT